MDILADNDQINFNPFEYTDYTGYLRFYTGDRELKFTPNNASNTLVDTTINFEDNMLYSVFFVGEENNLQTFITEDVIPEANPGNALVRVVHLSPDAPAVDLSSTGEDGNMPIFEAVSYKSTSEFEEIEAGTTSFELTTVGGSEVIASVSDITFQPGRVYSLIIRGYNEPPAGNTNGLSVQVTSNFFNNWSTDIKLILFLLTLFLYGNAFKIYPFHKGVRLNSSFLSILNPAENTISLI